MHICIKFGFEVYFYTKNIAYVREICKIETFSILTKQKTKCVSSHVSLYVYREKMQGGN